MVRACWVQVVISADSETYFAAPITWIKVHSKKKGDKKLHIWRAVPPSTDFVSLGDVLVNPPTHLNEEGLVETSTHLQSASASHRGAAAKLDRYFKASWRLPLLRRNNHLQGVRHADSGCAGMCRSRTRRWTHPSSA